MYIILDHYPQICSIQIMQKKIPEKSQVLKIKTVTVYLVFL